MTTGDLRNCGTKLQSLLRAAKYPADINYSFLFYGYPQEFLPLLHFIFQDYSLPFTKALLKKGYEMGGKSDKQFVETVYRILRDEFQYVPRLSRDKFFANGYTEQKLILTNTAYQYVLDRCRSVKKLRHKHHANKENSNPNSVEPVRMVPTPTPPPPSPHPPSTLPRPEIIAAPPSSAEATEHTPIRLPPKPDNSQTYHASLHVEESIIDIDGGDIMHHLTRDGDDVIEVRDVSVASPPVLTYSEDGAREVYVHRSVGEASEPALDSTPKTVISDVQEVLLSKNTPDPQTCVIKEVPWQIVPGEADCVSRQSSSSAESSSYSCNHGDDIAEIKKMLITMNARLDILESKSNHMTAQRLKTLSDLQMLTETSGLDAVPTSSLDAVPRDLNLGTMPTDRGILKTPREVSFNLSPQARVISDVSTSECSSADSTFPTTDSTEEKKYEEEDIKSFLKSVSERLHDTRSFLRTYDTS